MRAVLKALVFGLFCVAGAELLAGPVNINTADAETLAAELQGIGPALAEAIIRDREENGPFETPEQITRVRGIGQRVLEDNRDDILVSDEVPVAR
jgi:competence protein ComEA